MIEITTILFLFFVLYSALFWVALWQLKEYRFDRLFVHLKDTQQGHGILFSKKEFFLLFLIGLYVFVILSDTFTIYFSYIVLLFYIFSFAHMVWFIKQKKFKRPVITVKSSLLVLFSFLSLLGLTFYSLTDKFLWFVILSLCIPFVVGFFVFLLSFPTEIYTDLQIQKAKVKRQQYTKLVVIAVSGSYGKSSTKEIIAHLLSEKFSVVKTPLSHNTPLAIAKTILDKITNRTSFFIVELGAYKKGEIAQLADMVGPTIGVTTAISDQHIAIYGSMSAVVESEKELMHFIPRKSFVLINAHNAYAQEMITKVKRKVIPFAISRNKLKSPHIITAFNVQEGENGVSWSYQGLHDTFNFSSPLLGKHTVENMLPAVFLARHFGLSGDEIKKRLHSLKSLPKTMEKKNLLPGITIIDDSFNASPESVTAAISYLKIFSKRKILVLSPLIELGSKGHQRHKEIGKALHGVDYLFLTNTNYFKDIIVGIHGSKTQVYSGTYTELARMIKDIFQKGDVVVFEGKEAGIVLKLLV